MQRGETMKKRLKLAAYVLGGMAVMIGILWISEDFARIS
jgi:hypothetical protein